jgi:hypothetical protein
MYVVHEADAMAVVALVSTSSHHVKERLELPKRFLLNKGLQRDVVYLG